MWTNFGLPDLPLPFQSCAAQVSMRAQRVGIARTVEEIVRRGLRLVAGAGRIGQRRGIGAGDVRDLVLRDEAGQRLGIGGAPAHDRRDLVADHHFLYCATARGTW